MPETTPDFIKHIDLDDGTRSIFFDFDAPPTFEVAEESGHEPGGYFWDGVVRWLIAQGQAPDVSSDPEAGMFSAQGTPQELDELMSVLTPYLMEEDKLAALIEEADAAGHDFDD